MSPPDSFDELELPPALVEALAAEGIEAPTELQRHAIPVLRRGNTAVLRGAPGSGLLVAYGAALLERIEPDGRQPGALVVTTDRERANGLAGSLARLASALDHRVAALDGPWALPELADILVCTRTDLERAVSAARVKLDQVRSFVLDGASALVEGDDAFASILSNLHDDLQIILVGESVTPPMRRFVERRMSRAVYLPPDAAAEEEERPSVSRGSLGFREIVGDEEEALARLVADMLGQDHDHVLLFFRSPDRAADAGDFLSLRGFSSGAPGDPDVPVWLGLDALEARASVGEAPGAVAVSVDVPTDADELDRRHGRWGTTGVVLARPRELPHLRRIGREAGYTLSPLPPSPPDDGGAAEFRDRVREVLRKEDVVPHLVLIEPLLDEWSAAEVAAALALLVRRRKVAEDDDAAPSTAARPSADKGRVAWVRLFVSVGEKDGVGPGDLLGAIVGETGIPADQVGRIDLKNTYSRVEIDASAADRVIRALNGTSIRGRSIRVDYDRGESRARGGGQRKGSGGRGGPKR